MMVNMLNNLDGAMLVRFFPEHEIVYAWFGGLDVNVFSSSSGSNIESFELNISENIDIYDVEGEINRWHFQSAIQ